MGSFVGLKGIDSFYMKKMLVLISKVLAKLQHFGDAIIKFSSTMSEISLCGIKL